MDNMGNQYQIPVYYTALNNNNNAGVECTKTHSYGRRKMLTCAIWRDPGYTVTPSIQ